jgi:PAS domain S-box-containing protein
MNEALLLSSVRQHELAEQSERAGEEVRANNALFEAIFNTSPIGMYLLDSRLRLRRASRMTRETMSDIVGLVGRDFIEVLRSLWPPEVAQHIESCFRHTLATGEPYSCAEFSEVRRDRGVREYYEWQIHRIALPEGGMGVVCYFVDIAQRVRMAYELRRQAADMAEADRRKNEFLAMLSHELRNPLAPISNAVQLLGLQKPESKSQLHARSVIERQVTQLTRLVDDLMQVSRITTGRIQLRRQRLSLDGVVDRAIETARPMIDRRRHMLIVSPVPHPVWIDGDAGRLEQVVVNLLDNATKYMDEGGRIWVTLARDGDDAVLAVRDKGEGIAPDMLSHVFELFTQAQRSLDRSQGGLGIGLSLVQRLVEMHGGTVTVQSTLGSGSEFTIRLPLAAAIAAVAPLPTAPVEEARMAPAATGLRVLVVDDNVDGAQTLASIMELEGHRVRVAHSGPAALREAAEYRPDVVVLDIGLPELNGHEVARRLRKLPGLEGVVLVALTGYGQESDREESRQAGFDHHLVKPAEYEDLSEILRIAAGGRREPPTISC